MRGANAGRWIELRDGRTGILYNRDTVKAVNGKFPVYVSKLVKQGDLFSDSSMIRPEDFEVSRVMVAPADMKTIGFID